MSINGLDIMNWFWTLDNVHNIHFYAYLDYRCSFYFQKAYVSNNKSFFIYIKFAGNELVLYTEQFHNINFYAYLDEIYDFFLQCSQYSKDKTIV